MQLLYRGVDSLDLRCGVDRADIKPSGYARQLFDLFDHWREDAKFRDPNLKIEIKALGCNFHLLRSPDWPYHYVLDNPDCCQIRIWNPASWGEKAACQTGQFYISFRSVWLAQHGEQGAVEFAKTLAGLFFITGRAGYWCHVSRIDWCADVQRSTCIHPDELKQFATRSRYKDWWFNRPSQSDHAPQSDNRGAAKPETQSQPSPLDGSAWLNVVPDRCIQRRWDEVETVYFGRFSSPINCRIYQKDKEIKVSDKAWVEKLWEASGNYQKGLPVYRTEFSLDGQALRSLQPFAAAPDGALPDFRDPEVLFQYTDQIWAYLTQSWLIQCDRKANGKKETVKLTKFWEAVSQAWKSDLKIFRGTVNRGTCAELRKQLMGVFLSLSAKMGLGRSLSAAHEEYMKLGDYLKSDQFVVDYVDRRDKFCLPDDEDDRDIDQFASDLSRKIRRDRINQGIGS